MILACVLALTLYTGDPILVNAQHIGGVFTASGWRGAKSRLMLTVHNGLHVRETPAEVAEKLKECGVPVK